MAQLHKRFSDEQLRVLFRGYCQGQFSRADLQEMLDIGKTRFFALLSEYRRDRRDHSIFRIGRNMAERLIKNGSKLHISFILYS
jgi:hypothetical protein